MFYKLKDNYLLLILFTALLVLMVFIRLVKLQIVDKKMYLEKSQSYLSSNEAIAAPRGKILDRYGRPLVTNRLGFSVMFQKKDMTDDQLNDIILNTVSLFQKNDDEYIDTFPIILEDGVYKFSSGNLSGDALDTKVRNFKFAMKVSDNFDAAQCMAALKKKFNLDNRYTKKQIRDIASVRYEMEVRRFSADAPFKFSSDASMATVSALEENAALYKGLSVSTAPVRDYSYGTLASHILGRVGLIYQDEYESLKTKGYSMNAVIGKDGIEKTLEGYIRGTDGSRSVSKSVGQAAKVTEVPATPGNNAVLTIDVDLQQVAENALAQTIENIKENSLKKDNKAGSDVGGGSVVVEDVNTGEILAMASYPSFDLQTFDKDFLNLSTDKSKPLFNRAISGAYPPGSVFKMLTTVAGLEEGVVTPSTVIVDQGVYEYYHQKFNCWIYTDTGGTHGPMDASNALKNSCNYYYYEVGKRLGIDKLVEYATKIGLGDVTGIEIDGETKGTLASKEYKEKNLNEIWYPGDTLQMAIGQSYNLFSPIQLASYTSTIANHGTIYKTHLTKCIRDHKTGAIIKQVVPKAKGKIEMSDSTYNAVTYGMRLVSYDGTASSTFGNFPIETCSKTGSSQINGGSANGVFVSYAPYQNPQIAISVVIENAGSGSATAPIVKAIYSEYFKLNPKDTGDSHAQKNALIG